MDTRRPAPSFAATHSKVRETVYSRPLLGRLRGLIHALVLLAISAQPVSGQTIQICGQGCFPPPNPYRWSKGVQQIITVSFDDASINDTRWPRARGDAVREAIAGDIFGAPNAIDEWNFATDFGYCIPIFLEHVSGTPSDIVIKMRPFGPEDLDFAETETSIGICHNITGVEIYFNAGWQWENLPNLALTVALHEVGHALGIAHDECLDCAITLMAGDGNLDPNSGPFHSEVDGPAKRTLETLYGSLCNDVCGRSRHYLEVSPAPIPGSIDFRFGGWDGCIGTTPCEPAPPFRLLASTNETFELATREGAGPFVTFAVVPSDLLSGGKAYRHAFPGGLHEAVFRLRHFVGSTLVEETFSYPAMDTAPASCPAVVPSIPAELELRVFPQEAVSSNLNVSNVAGEACNPLGVLFSVSPTAVAPIVTVSPTQLIVAPQESGTVLVTAMAGSAAPGRFRRVVTLQYNTGLNAHDSVAVIVNVISDGVVLRPDTLRVSAYENGHINVGCDSLRIANEGENATTLTAIGMPPWISIAAERITVPNGDSAITSVCIREPVPPKGAYVGTLQLSNEALGLLHQVPVLLTVAACRDTDSDGSLDCEGDCNDDARTIYPGAAELCDDLDNDCDGQVDEDIRADTDGDGFTVCDGDCNDNDPAVHPGGTEACNGRDDDCDGIADDGFDLDGDGYTTCAGDCNDSDFFVRPGAREQCDARDNDCDSRADEGCGGGEPISATFPKTFTSDDDFDAGTLINVNHDTPTNNQLQLNEVAAPLPYVNVPNSNRGTLTRINVSNGQVLGEYRTAPEGFPTNPSRCTVDFSGSVWAGNRNELSGGKGSVVKVGLVVGGTRVDASGTPNTLGKHLRGPFLTNTCVDRNKDGLITTSNGLGDIRRWVNRTDGAGGNPAFVEDAEDECILCFQRVEGDRVRHVSIDANNNVWTGGHLDGSDNAFELIDGTTGSRLAGFREGRGGYGGLVDGNGVLWSANRDPGQGVLRHDTKGTITTSDDTNLYIGLHEAYGVGIDSKGDIWVSQYDPGTITKLRPDGSFYPGFPKGLGGRGSRGVAVTDDDNVWVANTWTHSVSRVANNGVLRKVIPVGLDPTGVAVDTNGKVWVSNLSSNNAMRIDPRSGPDGLGAVDMTVNLGAGAGSYGYSDMTGQVALRSTSPRGTWSATINSGVAATPWGTISWSGTAPVGTSIRVDARAADQVSLLTGVEFIQVESGVPFAGVFGEFIEIRVTLTRPVGLTESAVLYDLTVNPLNEPPDCKESGPTITELWPPNHQMVRVGIKGVTDPDGDTLKIEGLTVASDEPVNDLGDGSTCPDAVVEGSEVLLRAERSGLGNGRVYSVTFDAVDAHGARCTETVRVCVPHDQSPETVCVADTTSFDATACGTAQAAARIRRDLLSVGSFHMERPAPNPFTGTTTISFRVEGSASARVELDVFDVSGRRVRHLAAGRRSPGPTRVNWDGRNDGGGLVGAGVYFLRCSVDGRFIGSTRLLFLR